MQLKIHDIWSDYELIDCGNGRKLEKFGEITLIRPEITATGKPALSQSEWAKMADAEFVETTKNKGDWKILKQVPEKWKITFKGTSFRIEAELSLTTSKHIGIFPEQIINWQHIEQKHAFYGKENFLNLFGYTGLSTVCASFFFEKATHNDAIKKNIEWTRRNAEQSGRANVRLITEDAQKFVEREIKRGNKYDGIILDPPAIGSGAKNERWIFDEMIENLLNNVAKIANDKSFIIMNLYSHSIYGMDVKELLSRCFPRHNIEMCEEVEGISRYGGKISHGIFVWLG